jgi:hypothetical protein
MVILLQDLNHATAEADLRDRGVLNSTRNLDLGLSAVWISCYKIKDFIHKKRNFFRKKKFPGESHVNQPTSAIENITNIDIEYKNVYDMHLRF